MSDYLKNDLRNTYGIGSVSALIHTLKQGNKLKVAKNRWNLMHFLAMYNEGMSTEGVIKHLGCDLLYEENTDGFTPIDLAQKHQSLKFIEAIRGHGVIAVTTRNCQNSNDESDNRASNNYNNRNLARAHAVNRNIENLVITPEINKEDNMRTDENYTSPQTTLDNEVFSDQRPYYLPATDNSSDARQHEANVQNNEIDGEHQQPTGYLSSVESDVNCSLHSGPYAGDNPNHVIPMVSSPEVKEHDSSQSAPVTNENPRHTYILTSIQSGVSCSIHSGPFVGDDPNNTEVKTTRVGETAPSCNLNVMQDASDHDLDNEIDYDLREERGIREDICRNCDRQKAEVCTCEYNELLCRVNDLEQLVAEIVLRGYWPGIQDGGTCAGQSPLDASGYLAPKKQAEFMELMRNKNNIIEFMNPEPVISYLYTQGLFNYRQHQDLMSSGYNTPYKKNTYLLDMIFRDPEFARGLKRALMVKNQVAVAQLIPDL